MERNLSLSIVIVNFNTYRFLVPCLDSIYQGDLSSDFEVIVVDNASKDGSVAQLKKNYPAAKLIVNKKNLGFAAANNQGIKRACGNLVLLLNPDTLISKDTLSKMLEFMERNPKVSVATCRVVLPSGQLDDACHRGFPTPWNAFCQFSGLASIFPYSSLFNGYHLGYKDLEKPHGIDSCAGAFMLVRHEVGEKIGWLDEDYFWYGEDLDFCFRVKERGGKIMFVPYTKIVHYKGVASGIKRHSKKISSASKETRELATQARFEVMRIFYNKHYQKAYPSWLTNLVMIGIRLKEYLGLLKYR